MTVYVCMCIYIYIFPLTDLTSFSAAVLRDNRFIHQTFA